MYYVEIQLDRKRFSDLLGDTIKSLELVPDHVMHDGPRQHLFDRIEIENVAVTATAGDGQAVHWRDPDTDQTKSQRVDAQDVGLSVKFRTFLATLYGAGSDRVSLDKTGIPVSSDVTIGIRAELDPSGKPTLSMQPQSASIGIPYVEGTDRWQYDAMLAAAQDAIKASIPSRTKELPLDQLDALGQPAANIGITTGEGRLVIRVQVGVGTPASIAEWRSFHQGDGLEWGLTTGATLTGREWAALINTDLLASAISAGVAEKARQQAGMTLQGGVAVDWTGKPEPKEHVTLYMVMNDYPTEPVATVESDIGFGVDHGQLTATSATSAHVDRLRQVIVAILLEAIAPVLGRHALSIVASVYAPGATAGVYFGVVGALLFVERIPVPGSGGLPGWDCASPATGLQICTTKGTQTLELSDERRMTMELDEVVGTDKALIERGRLISSPPLPSPELFVESVQQPAWLTPNIPCSAAGDAGKIMAAILSDRSAFVAAATASLRSHGRASRIFAHELVSSDPDHVVVGNDLEQVSTGGDDLRLKFRTTLTYDDRPYPFAVVVRSTGGVQLVKLDPVPPLTAETMKRLTAGVLTGIGKCFELQSDYWREFHRLSPKWIVDPEIRPEEMLMETWEGLAKEGSRTGGVLSPISRGGRFDEASIAEGRRLIAQLGRELYR